MKKFLTPLKLDATVALKATEQFVERQAAIIVTLNQLDATSRCLGG